MAIKNTTFDFNSTDTHIFIDKENKMVLRQNPAWDPTRDQGKGDAIGRNFDAMIAWGDEVIEIDGKKMLLKTYLMKGIMSCWQLEKRKTWFGRLLKGQYYYQGYRYPTYVNNEEIQHVGLSRDHTLYTILAMCYMGWSKKEIWNFVKRLRWRISSFSRFTINLWLWARVVSGRKFAGFFYYPIEYVIMTLTAWTQLTVELISKIGPHYEVDQNEFKFMENKDKSKRVKIITKLLYPVYSLKQQALQLLYVNKYWGNAMRKVLLQIVPNYNFVIQLLLNDNYGPWFEEVLDYKPMIGDRWTGTTDVFWNDRTLEIIPETDKSSQVNCLDVDYLRALYNKYGIN